MQLSHTHTSHASQGGDLYMMCFLWAMPCCVGSVCIISLCSIWTFDNIKLAFVKSVLQLQKFTTYHHILDADSLLDCQPVLNTDCLSGELLFTVFCMSSFCLSCCITITVEHSHYHQAGTTPAWLLYWVAHSINFPTYCMSHSFSILLSISFTKLEKFWILFSWLTAWRD